MLWGTLGQVAAAAASLAAPAGLRCEYMSQPLGIDVVAPRLSWVLADGERGAEQTGYQVLVASSLKMLGRDHGDRWDSGRVHSDQSAHIVYAGAPLSSRTECYWKVRVWDEAGRVSRWSKPAHWTMGLLGEKDWQGQWMGHFDSSQREADAALGGGMTFAGCQWIWFPEGDPRRSVPAARRFFRRTFEVANLAGVSEARLLLTVDVRYAVYLNGQLVRKSYDHGNSWMRAYETEVTSLLKAGRNVLAIEAGSAGNRAAGVIAKLVVLSPGQPLTTLVSDAAWKCAQEEVSGWTNLSFDDGRWSKAMELGEVGIQPWGNHWTGWAQEAPSPMFRKAFTIDRPVRSAKVYVAGLGYHELRLNGHKVGDHVLDPAFTKYDRRVLYVTHDVTEQLRRGENALGVMLGNGWFNVENFEEWDFLKAPWRGKPRARVQLEIEYADGSRATVGSDASWKASTGPVRLDGIRNGEVYDARREQPGWDRAGFDDTRWSSASLVAAPTGTLQAQMLPPIRVTQTLRPVKMTEPRPGVFVFDMGQNMAGWVRLQVRGQSGQKVTLRYGEKLAADGRLDQYPIDCFVYQGPFQTDVYTLKGGGLETWEPRFVYHGFQYVEVSGFPGRPSLDSVQGRVVHTDFASAGDFACSDPMLNRIYSMARWSFRGNFHGYPTDCPQREKNGWTGDAHVFAETALLNFDMAASYEKWMRDFLDERRPDGQAAAIIPTSGWGYGLGPSWDSACVMIPWFLHVYTGDTRVLEDNYEQMKRYVDFLSTRAKDGLVSYGLGDWMYPKTATPSEVTGTGYFYADSLCLSKIAAILGRREDAEKYEAQALRAKQAYQTRIYHGQGVYANGSQTAQSCPLWHGLVPETEKEAVARKLLAAVETQGGHVDVGIIGIKYLLPALSQVGLDEVAYRMVTQTTAPGWGDWVQRGATTCWEDWAGEFSRNHYAFGTVAEWFVKSLAGIIPDPQAPGFKHFEIRPKAVRALGWVRAHYDSIRGRIEVSWRQDDHKFACRVTVPPNSSATVYLPADDANAVWEGGRALDRSAGVRLLRMEGGCAVVRVLAGRYVFTVKRNKPRA